MIDYFERKIKSDKFKNYFNGVLNNLKGKKVLIYGVGAYYKLISEMFDLSGLDIQAFVDEKIDNFFENHKLITPQEIKKQSFETVLIMSENYGKIEEFLDLDLALGCEISVISVLDDLINEESAHLEFLKHWNFEKTLENMAKKFKDKKILLYGAGAFFETIDLYFDLSKLNIIGIADRKFEKCEGNNVPEYFYGYKTVSPSGMETLNADYILVAMLSSFNVIEDFEKKFKGSRFKILPLVPKNFWQLLKEIWE